MAPRSRKMTGPDPLAVAQFLGILKARPPRPRVSCARAVGCGSHHRRCPHAPGACPEPSEVHPPRQKRPLPPSRGRREQRTPARSTAVPSPPAASLLGPLNLLRRPTRSLPSSPPHLGAQTRAPRPKDGRLGAETTRLTGRPGTGTGAGKGSCTSKERQRPLRRRKPTRPRQAKWGGGKWKLDGSLP